MERLRTERAGEIWRRFRSTCSDPSDRKGQRNSVVSSFLEEKGGGHHLRR